MMTSFLAISIMLGSEPDAAPIAARLALTPVLDGAISMEEWDSFDTRQERATYFQWEPGYLHLAAEIAVGDDLVVHLDPAGDGWLIGDDNIELRFVQSGSLTLALVRKLDATRRDGPVWVPASSRGVDVVTSENDGKRVIEASFSLDENRITKAGKTLGVSMDSVPAGADLGPAFLPRSLDYVKLGYDRSENLPTDMTWKSETRIREVAREDSLKMRFAMNGGGSYSLIKMRCEGLVQNELSSSIDPFRGFDGNGRASVEYKSSISPSSQAGWRVVRATLVSPDGSESVMRTSFKLSELIEFDIELPDSVEFSVDSQSIKGSVHVRSTGLGRVEGEFGLSAPKTWSVERGGDSGFIIYHPRGREKIGLKFIVPAGAVGEYPVTFTAQVGQRSVEKTVYIRIDPPTE